MSSPSVESLDVTFKVESPNVEYFSDKIVAKYGYETTVVDGTTVRPITTNLQIQTQTRLPRTGVLLVGIGGNNGSTCKLYLKNMKTLLKIHKVVSSSNAAARIIFLCFILTTLFFPNEL